MSKYQKPNEEEIYPVSTVVLENFLQDNGFKPEELNHFDDYMSWRNGDLRVTTPRYTMQFTKSQVEKVLIKAALNIDHFEETVSFTKDSSDFNFLIDNASRNPEK